MSRTTYRKMVEDAMKDDTESGRKWLAILLRLAPAVDGVVGKQEALVATNQSWTDKLALARTRGNASARTALERQIALRDATDESTRAIMRQVYAEEDRATALEGAMEAVTRAVNAEKDRVTKAYEAQSAALEKSLDSVTKVVDKLKSFTETLQSTLDTMLGTQDESMLRREAQSQIAAALAIARAGGPLPLDGQLTKALGVVAKPSAGLFGNREDYRKDFYRTVADVSALNDLAVKQLTADEITQDLLQQQLDNAKSEYDQTIEYLDQQVDLAQQAVDAANGINTSVMSVTDAVNALYDLIAQQAADAAAAAAVGKGGINDPTSPEYTAARAGFSVYKPGDPTSSTWATAATGAKYSRWINVAGFGTSGIAITDPNEIARLDGVAANLGQYSWAPGDKAASAASMYEDAMANGWTMADIAAASGYTDADIAALFASGGITPFAVGTNLIPHDMLALLHQGEAVVPAAYNPANNGGTFRNDEAVLARFDAMIARLERVEAATRDTADNTRRTDKTLTFVTQGGTTMQASLSTSVLAL